jgi:two-component system LytT family response regulator
MNFTYIIIEDQKGALLNLRTAHATNVKEGTALVLSIMPHLVFLDVELGSENGFDVLKEVRQHTDKLPFFIMTTDYLKYAKEAVNKDVLYFLDKPIDTNELAIALSKVQKQFFALQNYITIKNTEGYHFVNLNEVCCITSNDNYCNIHFELGNTMTVTRTLKDIETILPSNFVRVHNSYIVNRKFVQMLNTSKKKIMLKITLNDSKLPEEGIPIGNTYLDKVRNIMLVAI